LLDGGIIREDLFYRLNVLYLEVPPLCMRKEDIPLLCREFLPKEVRKIGVPLLEEMMPYLLKYSWPGNIRELLNFTQRLTFFLEDYEIGTSGFKLLKIIAPDLIYHTDQIPSHTSLRERVAAQEEAIIARVLDQSTTLADAAAQLGIGKTTLWRKIQKIKKYK
jgi:propionate catabolism operon transcriptional regulator